MRQLQSVTAQSSFKNEPLTLKFCLFFFFFSIFFLVCNTKQSIGTPVRISIGENSAVGYSNCVWQTARCARGNGAPSGKLTAPSLFLSSPGTIFFFL